MVSIRVSVLVLLAIGMIASFQQASALKCYNCDSKNNANCAKEPTKVEVVECKKEETTTTSKTTDGSTESTEASSTSTGVEETTTTAQPTPTTTSATTTTGPTTTTTEATTTAATTTQATTTQATTTQATTTEATTTEATTTQATTTQETDETNQNYFRIPFVESVPKRFRRNAVSRAESDFECYKLIFKEGDKEITQRGCQEKQLGCDSLKQGKSGAECHACSDDECNSSSSLSLGLLSVLIPVGIVALFTR